MSPANFLLSRWLLGVLLMLSSPLALADLVLFPTRLVFDGNQRAAQVELMNQGKSPETYRLSLVNRRMGENGEFIAIETPGPGEQFADGLLRYSPRQVTLPPGGSQVVRLQLRKPDGLAAGEYRSHLQIDRVAEASGSSSVEAVAQRSAKDVGIAIQALVGASIPVIVRHGATQASVSLSELSLLTATPAAPGGQLQLQMNRQGNRSVYGDLLVVFTTTAGVTVELAKAGGVAVYAPNALRRARLPLQLPAGTALRGGTLKVSYRDRPEAGGKLLAEASLVLP
ncbi:molecular chaperone [Pelomonas sp. SE-A7]|uniref:fimbrial biogenesis chaperone n=1 Tax=Pelomonas sp. SE-A7 TaxID=3054953 RepID=UPI00259C9181|nr:molecular chaperone [Pelomonas sp. SE-A7]MDM4764967.1 molecular chaperone [Pelomonas sp. SE-A7]